MGAIKTTRLIPEFVPARVRAHTISDSTALDDGGPRGDEPTCGKIRAAVTAAGNLVLVDWYGNSTTHHFPAAGVYEIPGNYRYVNSTGATATLSPANTVLALYWS